MDEIGEMYAEKINSRDFSFLGDNVLFKLQVLYPPAN